MFPIEKAAWKTDWKSQWLSCLHCLPSACAISCLPELAPTLVLLPYWFYTVPPPLLPSKK